MKNITYNIRTTHFKRNTSGESMHMILEKLSDSLKIDLRTILHDEMHSTIHYQLMTCFCLPMQINITGM